MREIRRVSRVRSGRRYFVTTVLNTRLTWTLRFPCLTSFEASDAIKSPFNSLFRNSLPMWPASYSWMLPPSSVLVSSSQTSDDNETSYFAPVSMFSNLTRRAMAVSSAVLPSRLKRNGFSTIASNGSENSTTWMRTPLGTLPVCPSGRGGTISPALSNNPISCAFWAISGFSFAASINSAAV